jgi:hypothetical protein
MRVLGHLRTISLHLVLCFLMPTVSLHPGLIKASQMSPVIPYFRDFTGDSCCLTLIYTLSSCQLLLT